LEHPLFNVDALEAHNIEAVDIVLDRLEGPYISEYVRSQINLLKM